MPGPRLEGQKSLGLMVEGLESPRPASGNAAPGLEDTLAQPGIRQEPKASGMHQAADCLVVRWLRSHRLIEFAAGLLVDRGEQRLHGVPDLADALKEIRPVLIAWSARHYAG